MEKKKIGRFLKRLLITVIAGTFLCISFCMWLNYEQQKKIERYIKMGRLQYFPSVGWVDWGHAIAHGPKTLVRDLYSDFGQVSYYQQMTVRKLGVNITIRLTNTYAIPDKLSDKGRVGIIHYIFSDVSKDFESLQGSFPFKHTCGTGIGDRNGDNIALLRSLCKSKYEPSLFQAVSKKEALEIYNRGDKKDRVNPIFEKRLGDRIKVRRVHSKTELILSI